MRGHSFVGAILLNHFHSWIGCSGVGLSKEAIKRQCSAIRTVSPVERIKNNLSLSQYIYIYMIHLIIFICANKLSISVGRRNIELMDI